MDPHMEKAGPPAYYLPSSEMGKYVINTFDP